ncbi:MAG: 2-oxoglutarate dehydrogenase E1 component, partial [Tenuifilaceae bacterium]
MKIDPFLGNIDPKTLDGMYRDYLSNPDSVEENWRLFFKGFDLARQNYTNGHGELFDAEVKVLNLIDAYRKRGHLFTKTNPVRARQEHKPTLDLENFGLSSSDLNTIFQAGKELGIGPAKLSDIVIHLQNTYCKSVGVEYMYIRDT